MRMTEMPPDVRALFDAPNTAHFASVLPDGSPHSIPLWVGLEGDQLAILTAPGSRKARNIEREPRVAVSVTDRDNPFTMAMVRGRVVEKVEGEAAWQIIDRISEQYLGGPCPQRSDRVVFLIEVEQTSSRAF